MRKTGRPKGDDLVITLHVENLVSPLASDIVGLESLGSKSINPSTAFRRPMPGGTTLSQEIVFSVPSSLNLNDATLRIHYYNCEGEIPLSAPTGKGVREL